MPNGWHRAQYVTTHGTSRMMEKKKERKTYLGGAVEAQRETGQATEEGLVSYKLVSFILAFIMLCLSMQSVQYVQCGV
jgi:hypothetical protein